MIVSAELRAWAAVLARTGRIAGNTAPKPTPMPAGGQRRSQLVDERSAPVLADPDRLQPQASPRRASNFERVITRCRGAHRPGQLIGFQLIRRSGAQGGTSQDTPAGARRWARLARNGWRPARGLVGAWPQAGETGHRRAESATARAPGDRRGTIDGPHRDRNRAWSAATSNSSRGRPCRVSPVQSPRSEAGPHRRAVQIARSQVRHRGPGVRTAWHGAQGSWTTRFAARLPLPPAATGAPSMAIDAGQTL